MERHECPGCGQPGVPNYMFACVKCWDALPSRLREKIKDTARLDKMNDRRLQAISDVATWYRDHSIGA